MLLPDRPSTLDLARTAASPYHLIQAVAHASVGAAIFAQTQHEVVLGHASSWLWVAGWITTAGVLAAFLWVISFSWRAAGARIPRSGRSDRSAWGRHLGMVLGAWVLLEVSLRTWLRPIDKLAWVFGTVWVVCTLVAGAVVLVFDRRDRARGQPGLVDRRTWLPTMGVMGSVAAIVWVSMVGIELVFHYAATTFCPWADITALLHGMEEEADVMILGHEALRLGGIACLTFALAGAFAVARLRAKAKRSDRATWGRRTTLAYALLVALSPAVLLGAGPWERKLLVHHVHPTVDDLALLLAPDLGSSVRAVRAEEEAAAQALYPELVADPLGPDRGAVEMRKPHRHARNVLLLFVDTLPKRHLECFGYEREVAPNLCRLAAESTVFTRAASSAGQTDNATVALFYSLLPFVHTEKRRIYEEGHGGSPCHMAFVEAGYRVGLFSADWEAAEQGFGPVYPEELDAFVDARSPYEDEAEEAMIREFAGRDEWDLAERFNRWVTEAQRDERPWMAYFKGLRPHEPYYSPPPKPGWEPPFTPAAEGYGMFGFRPFEADRELLLNRYDNALYYVDIAFGRIMDHLAAIGAWEETAVVFIADHGEAWGEHDLFGHAVQHYEEFLDVPLFVRVPGEGHAQDDRLASTIDVAPTILDLGGLPQDPDYQGRSLLHPDWQPRVRIAFSNNTAWFATIQVDLHKLTWNPWTDERWLFDLEADPKELDNLAWRTEPEHVQRRDALSFLLKRVAARQLDIADELRARAASAATPLRPSGD